MKGGPRAATAPMPRRRDSTCGTSTRGPGEQPWGAGAPWGAWEHSWDLEHPLRGLWARSEGQSIPLGGWEHPGGLENPGGLGASWGTGASSRAADTPQAGAGTQRPGCCPRMSEGFRGSWSTPGHGGWGASGDSRDGKGLPRDVDHGRGCQGAPPLRRTAPRAKRRARAGTFRRRRGSPCSHPPNSRLEPRAGTAGTAGTSRRSTAAEETRTPAAGPGAASGRRCSGVTRAAGARPAGPDAPHTSVGLPSLFSFGFFPPRPANFRRFFHVGPPDVGRNGLFDIILFYQLVSFVGVGRESQGREITFNVSARVVFPELCLLQLKLHEIDLSI